MTGFDLKIFAAVAMLIDHIGAYLFPDLMILRIIGRFSLPVFAWFIAEGCRHTRSIRNYSLRLAIAAVVAEPCVDFVTTGSFAMDWSSQNIMLTLLFGVLSIWAFQRLGDMAGGAAALLCCSLAQLFNCEYKWYGVVLVLLFYYCNKVSWQAIGYLILSLLWKWDMLIGWITNDQLHYYWEWPHQLWGVLAFIPLALYNGKPGVRSKWFFYIFYPAHLLLIGLLAHQL
jgi:hypothetical protein